MMQFMMHVLGLHTGIEGSCGNFIVSVDSRLEIDATPPVDGFSMTFHIVFWSRTIQVMSDMSYIVSHAAEYSCRFTCH